MRTKFKEKFGVGLFVYLFVTVFAYFFVSLIELRFMEVTSYGIWIYVLGAVILPATYALDEF
jgi:hypothetical protein